MKKIIVVISILFTLTNYAQTDTLSFIHAYPVIGWDSLKTIMQNPENYPVIARRAGVTTSISVYLLIDSIGNFIKVEPTHKPIVGVDSLMNKLFIPSITKVFNSVKWIPGYKNNNPINDKIYLLFNFYLFDPDNKTFNIIAPREKSRAVY